MSPLFQAVIFLSLTVWITVLTILVLKLREQLSQAHHAQKSAGLRYWSLVKFNPFADVGGQESFVVILLDEQKNGIVLTNLHGRGNSRFYIKKVTAGHPEQNLSQEEKQALDKALNYET